jgi:hypothetical protein
VRLFLCAFLLSLLTFPCAPSHAFDLFFKREITVHFATAQGEPLANAAVRVFAPRNPEKPAFLGRTDGKGDFSFSADRKGFWTAEAASAGEIARVMVRVGAGARGRPFAPRYFLRGLVLILLVVALGIHLFVRRRRR